MHAYAVSIIMVMDYNKHELILIISFGTQKQLFSARYLEKHGNMDSKCQYISSDDSIQCSSYTSEYRRLLSVPLGAFLDHVVADITVAVDPKYGNAGDSDFIVALSDGSKAVGFWIVDTKNYFNYEPCTHVEGTPGNSLTNPTTIHNGPLVSTKNFYPQRYNFLISTRQQSGACLTATEYEGAYTTIGYYNATLEVGSQLTVDIYGDKSLLPETYIFKYFVVDVHIGL